MAVIPEYTSPTIEAIYRSYESKSQEFREHLGASVIGRECERELWYQFRWFAKPSFSGRILRLFETGWLAEDRFIDNLRAVGVTVWDRDEDGEQFGFTDLDGHFAGSCDGVARGIIESPKTPHLLEFKTHGSKSFSQLKLHGVYQSKPEHYAQMVLYMDYLNLQRGYYLSVNKDTDELYGERIKPDPVKADDLKLKAKRIIYSNVPRPKLSEDASFWKCKFCDFQEICHYDATPERNCRTCLYGRPGKNSSWECRRHSGVNLCGRVLNRTEILDGCDFYDPIKD